MSHMFRSVNVMVNTGRVWSIQYPLLNRPIPHCQLARERTGEGAKAAALIPQYRMAIVKARAQASALRERLAEGASERAALREQVESLQKALRERWGSGGTSVAPLGLFW